MIQDKLTSKRVKNHQPQNNTSIEYRVLFKKIIKHSNYFLYVAVSECLLIPLACRIDIYLPITQTHFSTFIDSQIILPTIIASDLS
jgi:isoprenylcysteine carboxyl methyltransferase (ICMT) family protein YpbQ